MEDALRDDGMKKILLSLLFLLIIPIANAGYIDESVQIKPSSGSGYYIINKTVYLEESIVNLTHAVFINLNSLNRTASTLNSEGKIKKTYCNEQQNCSIPYTDTTEHLIFRKDTTPKWINQTQEKDELYGFETNILSSNLTDNVALGYATLATTETGEWRNRSTQALSGSSSIVKFTWSNSSITKKWIRWRIYFNDSLGNQNVTDDMRFEVKIGKPGPGPRPTTTLPFVVYPNITMPEIIEKEIEEPIYTPILTFGFLLLAYRERKKRKKKMDKIKKEIEENKDKKKTDKLMKTFKNEKNRYEFATLVLIFSAIGIGMMLRNWIVI